MLVLLILCIIITIIWLGTEVNRQANKNIKVNFFLTGLLKNNRISKEEYDKVANGFFVKVEGTVTQESKENIRLKGFLYNLYKEGRITQEEYERVVYNKINEDETETVIKSVPTIEENISQQVVEQKEVKVENKIPDAYENHTVESKKGINLTAILIIGVLFVVFAGLVFATTTWQTLDSISKVGIIVLGTSIFFGISEFAEKKLKLIKTGIAFFVLGSLFGVISIISIGFFKVFGEWFSLVGEGKNLLFMFAFLALGTFACIGALKYKIQDFAWATYFSTSAAIICLILLFEPSKPLLSLLIAIYSLLFVLIATAVSNKERNEENILLSPMKGFAIINTAILSIISISVSTTGVVSFFSMGIFSLLFLKSIFNEDNGKIGVYPFAIFMMLAIGKIIAPEKLWDYGFIILTTALTSTILSMTGLIDGNMKKVMRLVSGGLSFIAFIITGISAVTVSQWTYIEQIMITVLLANITWLGIRNKDKLMLELQTVIMIFFVNGIARLLSTNIEMIAMLTACFSFIIFILYFVIEKNYFRTVTSDFLLTGTTFACAIITTFIITLEMTFVANPGIVETYKALVCSGIFALMTYMLTTDKNNTLSKFYGFILPGAIEIIFTNIGVYMQGSAYARYVLFTYFILICAIATSAFLIKRKFVDSVLADKFALPFEIMTWIIGVIGILSIRDLPYGWILAAFCMTRAWFSRKNERTRYFYIGTIMIYIATLNMGENLIRTDDFSSEIFMRMFLLAIVSLIYFAVPVAMKLLRKESTIEKELNIAASVGLTTMSVIMTICLREIQNPEFWQIFITLLLPILAYTNMMRNKNNVAGFTPVLAFYWAILSLIEDREMLLWTLLLLTDVFASLGRLVHDRFLKKDQETTEIDWLTTFCIIPIIAILSNGNAYWIFTGWILTAVWFALYYNRTDDKQSNNSALTLSGAALCTALFKQPFIDIPKIIELEFNLLPLIAFCAILKVIWKDSKNEVGMISFGTAVFSMLLLIKDAIVFEELVDTLIIGVSSVIMLLISFSIKKKRWFMLSTVVLVSLTIYMSRQFWLSIAWEVYLLTAGIVLIAFAAMVEIKKQRGEKLFKEKTQEIMHDWEW